MGKFINKSQSGFLKEGNIMDGVMALHENLHDTRIKKKEGLVLKLDFKKVYDKINWQFLLECLRQTGFDKKWCEWIKLVMTSGTLNVKVNNTCSKYFKSGKGVRQGDLLSPFLFNIATDTLAKIINLAQKNHLIEGLVPGYVEYGVAILQYVDDTFYAFKMTKSKLLI
jgi:hypothetical protein